MLNRLKKFTIFLIFINIFNVSKAQETQINIENEYKSKSYIDPDYYEIVVRYAQKLLIDHKVTESFTLLEKEYKKAKKLNDYGNFSYLKAVEAIQYSVIGEKDKSIKNFQEAKVNAEKTKNLNNKAYVNYAGGWLAVRNNNKVEAVKYFINSLKFYYLIENSNDLNRRKTVIYQELAWIYGEWNDYEMQKKYTLKALEYALQQDNQDTIFSAYMTLGYMYEKELHNNPSDEKIRDLTEFNYLKAITIFEKNQMLFPSDLSYVALNLANLYIKYYPISYKEKAREYALLAKNVAIANDEHNHVATVMKILGEIAILENKKNQARNLLLEAIQEIEKSIKKDSNIELAIYENLIRIENEQENYKQAQIYQQKYLNIYKDLYNSEKLEISKRLEAEFEQELQEKELEKLQLLSEKKEQKIQLLNLKNLERETQFNNLKLIEENKTKKLILSELSTQKKQQELKLAKLETRAKTNDLINYQERLSFKEQVNKFYTLIIISIILIVLLLLFLLRQRTKRMLEKEKSYRLAIEKEKQRTKISALTSLLDGQERERERLARDLHDGLGGLLSATKLQISDLLEKKNATQNEELKTISEHIDFAINKLRKVSHNLMPDLIIKYGLEVALKEFANRMKNNNLEIHVTFLSYTNTLSTDKQLFVYRIIQELVNNAIKHAEAKQILIQLVEEKNLYQITVEDDGKGFEINNLEFKNSAGFINIQSRIQFLKGTFEMHSQKNLGTSFEFNFPKK